MNDSTRNWFRLKLEWSKDTAGQSSLITIVSVLRKLIVESVELGSIHVTISNIWFADYIDAVAEEKEKLESPIDSLDETCTKHTWSKCWEDRAYDKQRRYNAERLRETSR